MATTEVVETSIANNNPSQDLNHPDDLFQSRNDNDNNNNNNKGNNMEEGQIIFVITFQNKQEPATHDYWQTCKYCYQELNLNAT